MNKQRLDRWKKKQVEKVFNRSKGACITSAYIENTVFFIKQINNFYKILLESNDIIEELPNIIVKPLQCMKCDKIIKNYNSIFVLSEAICCKKCEKKND